jgi:hypothetical protein
MIDRSRGAAVGSSEKTIPCDPPAAAVAVAICASTRLRAETVEELRRALDQDEPGPIERALFAIVNQIDSLDEEERQSSLPPVAWVTT